MPSTPKAYIAYSYDNEPFKDWVKEFADKLINMGVEITLDQYDLPLTGNIPEFMEKGIIESDFVIFLITPGFVNKAKLRKGGVGYEIKVSAGEIFVKGKARKYIPVLIQVGFDQVPGFLLGDKAVRITDLKNYKEQFIELYAHLTGQALKRKPPLGNIVDIKKLSEGVKEKDLFEIEGLKKQSQMEDFVLWKFHIVNNAFKEDEFTYLFPKYRKSFLSKYQGQLNRARFYPSVLDPSNLKSAGSTAVYESKDLSVSNWHGYEKALFSGNTIDYGCIEFMKYDPRMVLVNDRIPLLSFFYLMVILKNFCTKEGCSVRLNVHMELTASIKPLYSFLSPLFRVKYNPMDQYLLPDAHFSCKQDFNDVEKKPLMKFFQRILGAFVSSSTMSTQPFLEIEEQDFEMVYSSIMKGNYWDPLLPPPQNP